MPSYIDFAKPLRIPLTPLPSYSRANAQTLGESVGESVGTQTAPGNRLSSVDGIV